MAFSHTQVHLRGYADSTSRLTFNLATGTTRDAIGQPMAIDSTAPNTVKVAGDGDHIIGRLFSWENREVEGSLVGAVELRFSNVFTGDGTTIAVGDTVVGSGVTAGTVKAAATANHSANVVVEVDGTDITVLKLF